MTEGPSSGATPQDGPDPELGATPTGQQQSTGGATPPASSDEGATPAATPDDSGLRQTLDRERAKTRDAERTLAEARRRIVELEDRGKTDDELRAARLQRAEFDLEQANTRIRELEADVARRELDSLKAQIAAEEGIPTLASRLQGNDIRTLRQDAKKLREERDAAIPTGSLGIGVGGGASGQRGRVDMNTLIRQAAGREE